VASVARWSSSLMIASRSFLESKHAPSQQKSKSNESHNKNRNISRQKNVAFEGVHFQYQNSSTQDIAFSLLLSPSPVLCLLGDGGSGSTFFPLRRFGVFLLRGGRRFHRLRLRLRQPRVIELLVHRSLSATTGQKKKKKKKNDD
jgi:hypothetical protein